MCIVLKDLNFLLVSEAIGGAALTATLMVFFGYPLFFSIRSSCGLSCKNLFIKSCIDAGFYTEVLSAKKNLWIRLLAPIADRIKADLFVSGRGNSYIDPSF